MIDDIKIDDGTRVDHTGTITYRKNGVLHREDGPAKIWVDGETWWCINGELHREDGPARTWNEGLNEWWIRDKQLTEQEFIVWKLQNLLK